MYDAITAQGPLVRECAWHEQLPGCTWEEVMM